ncbi:MAG: DEAD/DEAH box helicase [Flavonifractor plautii]
MAESGRGILQSPAGSGKTQIGIALACEIGQKTLWLTHTRDLLLQSKNRAEQYMSPALTGTITEGKVQIGKAITFATVQTMCNIDLDRYRDTWGCIIVDECHRVAGTPTAVTQFSKVLSSLAAKHKYGLSATVHRADGMIAATYALLGKIAYQVPEEAVADKIMTVSVLPRPTRVGLSKDFLDTDGTIIYAKLVNYLAEDFRRNGQIVGDLMLNSGHYNLDSCPTGWPTWNILMAHLPKHLRDQAVMVDGKMTSKKGKAKREQAIEDMRAGKKHYLFATYALAKEGLDIPRLDRLYLTTPQKDYAIVTQSVGRIARTFEGKGEPIVYDYVDDGIQYLVRSYKKRCTSYRKCGCKIME